jgi:hypothetical protein
METPNAECEKYHRLVLILGLAGFISAADNWFVASIFSGHCIRVKIFRCQSKHYYH